MSESQQNSERDRQSALRVAIAIGTGLIVGGYTLGVVSGYIHPDRQISAVHLGIIGIAAFVILLLLRPDSLSRLKLLEMSGFKLEMLERVKEKQVKQAELLEDIELILPLLLPETERKHLLNLKLGTTNGYKGSGAFRAEVRRLRSMGLVEMQPSSHVGHMKSDMEFDLADYVKLTDLGERWIKRITQIEKGDGDPRDN